MKMNLRDIFIKVEHENQLLSSEIDGCLLWSYSRNYIYQYFFRKLHNHNDAHEKLSIFEQIKRYSSSLPHIVFNYIYLKRLYRTHKATLVFAHPRRNLIDGKYVSIYTDMIIPDNWNTFTFEQTYTYKHFSPAFSPNLIYLDNIEIKGKGTALWDKVVHKKHYDRIKQEVSEKILPYISLISQETGIPADNNALLSLCLKNFFLAKVSENYWRNVINKADIERVIEVVGYSIPAKALNKISKNKNICTIEVQHGMLSKEHMGYQYHECDNCSLAPDYFLTFSDYWNNEVNIPSCCINSIGFEYFNHNRSTCNNQNNKRDVLFISQMNVGGILSDLAKKTSSLLFNKGVDAKIYYKLHPSEFTKARELYPDLFTLPNVEVIKNERNLYDLFSISKIQVGYNSTALFEGIGFNIFTFLIENDDYFIQKLISSGYASFIDSEQDIFEKIIANDIVQSNKSIWKDNAKDNFIQLISQIKS